MKSWIINIFFVISCLLFVAQAFSETVEVFDYESGETIKLELAPHAFADLLVFLKSFGDMVDNYMVILKSDLDNSRVGALLSDRHGMVRFERIPPGKYRLELVKKVKEDNEKSTVSIGDIRLLVSKKIIRR